MIWLIVAAAALAVLLFLLFRRATRLDRLHRKVVATRVALEGQLVRRAIAAADLAKSGLLDPASSMLVADSAYAVIDAGDDNVPASRYGHLTHDGLGPRREALESALSATVREALDDVDDVAAIRAERSGPESLDHLAGAWYRAQLARRFHNEAVGQAQRARRHWWVRLLRLAGNAPMPLTVELDDNLPSTLTVIPDGA
jgi:hypothetical protein